MSTQKCSASVFGKRLKSARIAMGIAQDRLGVQVGLDEGSSSARMSRYESGVHEPSYLTASKIATALSVPVAYLYCEEDEFAEIILLISKLSAEKRKSLFDELTKS